MHKFDRSLPVQRLTGEYGVGATTIYDLTKQKDNLFKCYSESDDPKLMKKRKTLHTATNKDLDGVLIVYVRHLLVYFGHETS